MNELPQKPKFNIPVVKNSFHYFISHGRYCISDLGYCAKSERTIDVNLFDIANNEKLLNIFHLHYMQGNFGVSYNYQSRAEWFCGYLASFKQDEEKSKLQYQKSITNPVVRILIQDESIVDAVLNCF
jgi:hypothetical protein